MHSQEDVLNRDDFIKKIKDLIIISSENRRSCCFAIEGEWGSGKSFVLKRIQEHLQIEQSEITNTDRFFIVPYNCWEYDYYEEPIIPIISALRDAIELYKYVIKERTRKALLDNAKNIITKVAVEMVKAKTGIDIEESIGTAENDEKMYDHYLGFRSAVIKVKKAIETIAQDQTVVIIVDELDRCLPTYAIKVLERIHHVFNELENVVVVIAMEKQQIENSLHQIYGDKMDVDRYLKKFISFSIKLDNGSAKNFIRKYASFMDMFNIQEDDELEIFFEQITSGIDIRTQEKIFEKAESMHRLIAPHEKMNMEIIAFEIFLLCIKEKMKVLDLRWVFELSGYPDIESEVGEEYFSTIRKYAEYIKRNPMKVNGKYICEKDNFIAKLIFIISGLYNEYKDDICGHYYCAYEGIQQELEFARKIYALF